MIGATGPAMATATATRELRKFERENNYQSQFVWSVSSYFNLPSWTFRFFYNIDLIFTLNKSPLNRLIIV